MPFHLDPQGFVIETKGHQNLVLLWPLTREAANWLHLIVEALWPDLKVPVDGASAAIRLDSGELFVAGTHVEAIEKATRAMTARGTGEVGEFERAFLIRGVDFMEAEEARREYALSPSFDLIWFNGGLAVKRSCSVMSRCLREAYAKAELEPLDGSLWHAWRRKWATERKDMPVKDVAEAGGWRDTATLLKSYQQSDESTVTQVVLEAPKLTRNGVNSTPFLLHRRQTGGKS